MTEIQSDPSAEMASQILATFTVWPSRAGCFMLVWVFPS